MRFFSLPFSSFLISCFYFYCFTIHPIRISVPRADFQPGPRPVFGSVGAWRTRARDDHGSHAIRTQEAKQRHRALHQYRHGQGRTF